MQKKEAFLQSLYHRLLDEDFADEIIRECYKRDITITGDEDLNRNLVNYNNSNVIEEFNSISKYTTPCIKGKICC